MGDVLFVLFRRKWLILTFLVGGLIAASAVYFLRPPVYVSEAKLLIRYVVERKTINATSPDSQIKALDSRGSEIVASEAAILSSFDLARAVVDLVTPEKILGKSRKPATTEAAAAMVASGLKVDIARGSSIIELSFQHVDPAVVQPVLTNLISLYLQKHVEVHRGAGTMDDFVASQADQLKGELSRTEAELQSLLKEAGVLSVEDGRREFSDQSQKIATSLRDAQAALAERQAAFQKMMSLASTSTNQAHASQPLAAAPAEVLSEYRTLLSQLELARKDEAEALSKYTEESKLVVGVRDLVRRLEARKATLETRHPQVLSSLPTTSDGRTAIDPTQEVIEIAALEGKIRALEQQLDQVKSGSAKLDRVQSTIAQLERDRVALETNYHYLKASLRQARFDEALGPGKVSNIYPVLHPTPPALDHGKRLKIAAGCGFGGVGIGIALAFLLELMIDRRVKRSSDVGRLLHLPLLLSIPRLALGTRASGSHANVGQRRSLQAVGEKREPVVEEPEGASSISVAPNGHPAAGGCRAEAKLAPGDAADSQDALRTLFKTRGKGVLAGSEDKLAPVANGADVAIPPDCRQSPVPPQTWHSESPLRPFSEALRDRLITHFEARNIAHKPKLVAVTSCSDGAGVSSLASSLAAVLSETGEGKVLLVDLNLEAGAAHPFHEGRPVLGMSEALDRSKRSHDSASLCIATANEAVKGAELPAVLPRSFRQLVPRLKNSDFDYIIFDMPTVNEVSVTPRLSSFMDLVVMVLEAEKTHLDAAKKAAWLLSQVKVEVACVLNKKRDYVPALLQQE